MNTTKPCPYCKEQVSANAIKCPHCQSELRSWFRRHPLMTALLLIFVVFPVGMGIFSTATDTRPEEKVILPGQNAFVTIDTYASVTKEVYVRASQLEQVNDKQGIQQLYSANFIFELQKNTTVLVIDRENSSGVITYQVRALEGKNKGKAGWVAKSEISDTPTK